MRRLATTEGTSIPSPPCRGEREGSGAERREGEVGIGNCSEIPHLTSILSAPGDGEGVYRPLL
jgi:hypothetical protein